MKRVEPPRPVKAPQLVAPSGNTEALIDTLRQRINDLETRIAALESVISLQNQDVIISAPKSVLIRGLDTVEISASGKLKIAASMTETNASIAKFSGILECDIVKANTVMGAAYTPGAGNIW
jgi:TolA-binding protein